MLPIGISGAGVGGSGVAGAASKFEVPRVERALVDVESAGGAGALGQHLGYLGGRQPLADWDLGIQVGNEGEQPDFTCPGRRDRSSIIGSGECARRPVERLVATAELEVPRVQRAGVESQVVPRDSRTPSPAPPRRRPAPRLRARARHGTRRTPAGAWPRAGALCCVAHTVSRSMTVAPRAPNVSVARLAAEGQTGGSVPRRPG